jgi:glycosyltransferase involved in cell wall biosynthesis
MALDETTASYRPPMTRTRVLFLPYETWRNPYQARLAQALSEQGIQVRLPASRPLLGAMQARLRGELDLVHFHWTSAFLLSHHRAASRLKTTLFFLACRVLKRYGVKLVWTVHNLVDHERRDPTWELQANRLLFRLCDRVIVHCPRAIDLVGQAYELPSANLERFAVIPHGHFINVYPNQISRRGARDKLGLPQGDHVFLYFGQVRPYKNLNALIDAFDRLDDPQAHLLIAGEPAQARLGQAIQDAAARRPRLHACLERIPDQQIQTFMNAADAVVLPFRAILTSSTLILAMSFGKAAITPSMGCSPDLLREQAGLLYNPYDPEGLLESMRTARSMDLEAIGKENQARICPFSWDTVGQLTATIYQDCLSAA